MLRRSGPNQALSYRMYVRDYPFSTATCTICEVHHLDTLYDGPVAKIPEWLKKYYVVRNHLNNVIKNTYMEVTL